MQTTATEPGNARALSIEADVEEVWVVGSLLEADRDGGWVDRHDRGGIDEVAKDAPRLRIGVFLSEIGPKEPVEAACHERELEVTVDLQGDGRGECVHVEEVDAVGDAVLDEHSLCIAIDELRR